MNFSVLETERVGVLLTQLRLGQERAIVSGRHILVSVALPASDGLDPVKVYSAGGALDTPRTFWARPDEVFYLVGIGCAVRLSGDGPESFERVATEYRRLVDEAVVDAPGTRGTGPVFIGGTRFDGSIAKSDLWRDFPDASLVLPRVLFTRSGGEDWFTVNILVRPETDVHAEARDALAWVDAVARDAPVESRQPDHVRREQDPRDEWVRWTRQALRAIETGRLTKVVLARRNTLYAGGRFSSEAAIVRLIEGYPDCSVFVLGNGTSSFVGATPEGLVRLEKSGVRISCLAGTGPRGGTPEEDDNLTKELLSSDKERREHSVVVQAVVQALETVCRELEWNEVPRVMRLRNVQHLLTSFKGQLEDGNDILRLVRLLHPTPALGGTPTVEALDLIRELEGDRGWYAAPVGWLDHRGEGEFSVAIRSALLRGDQATLFAGAGIVEGSDPDREFDETELKLLPLLDALGGC